LEHAIGHRMEVRYISYPWELLFLEPERIAEEKRRKNRRRKKTEKIRKGKEESSRRKWKTKGQ
jgi:hypothetical protein